MDKITKTVIEANKFYKEINKFFELITDKEAIIIGHKGPDGDCISSICFLKQVLPCFDCKTQAILVDEVPERLSIIPCSNEIQQASNVIANASGDEILIIADCATLNGLGLTEEEFAKFKTTILIDHHEFGNLADKCTLSIIYPKYTSCAHLLYKLFETYNLCWLNHDTARTLYIGMNTDSINFTVEGVNAMVFENLATLVAELYPNEIFEINKKLYRSVSREAFDYKLKVLSNVKFRDQDNGIGIASYACHDIDFVANDISKSTVALYNDIADYEICYYIKAVAKNRTRVSIRSRNMHINVALVMKELFGGGGHAMAAGALAQLPSAEAEKILEQYQFEKNQ